MMKYTIVKILVVIVLGIVAVFILNLADTVNAPDNIDEAFIGAQIPVPNTAATVQIDDVSTNPQYPYPLGRYDTGEERGSLTLITPLAVALADSDTSVVPFAVNYGGSGEFIFVGLFTTSGNEMIFTDSYPLGDRVDVQDILYEDIGYGVRVTVNYLTHEPAQSLAEDPQMPESLVIDVVDNNFADPQNIIDQINTTACYQGIFGEGQMQDIAEAKIVYNEQNVSGIFNWLPAQKDSLRGVMQGSVVESPDAVLFDTVYSYQGEGMDLKDEKMFSLQDGMLSVSFGELETQPDENQIYRYVDKANLEFSLPMSEVSCEEIDFTN